MSLVVSYLVIPAAILLLAVNFYFRFIIIKQYKGLRDCNIEIDPKILLSKSQRAQYIEEKYPKHAEKLERFSDALIRLVKYVLYSFVLILGCFLYIYFNQ